MTRGTHTPTMSAACACCNALKDKIIKVMENEQMKRNVKPNVKKQKQKSRKTREGGNGGSTPRFNKIVVDCDEGQGPPPVMADFGQFTFSQSIFGQPFLSANLGHFGPMTMLPNPCFSGTLSVCVCVCLWCVVIGELPPPSLLPTSASFCATLAANRRAGSHKMSLEKPKRTIWVVPWPRPAATIPREDPRERERERNWGGRAKKREMSASPPFGAPTFRALVQKPFHP